MWWRGVFGFNYGFIVLPETNLMKNLFLHVNCALKQLSAIKPPGCTAPLFLTSNFVNGRGHRDHDPDQIVI